MKKAIFYIASNDGSVLLSCNTSLALDLIHQRPKLNYLPLRASLITSSADHPRRTTVQLQIQKQEITMQTTNQQQDTQITISTQTAPKLITSQDQIMHEYPEIESLAVVWAVEKYHHFLYGCHFTLETDQNPLEAILSRSLNQATPRLQCILIRTLPYNFTVCYIPGPKIS